MKYPKTKKLNRKKVAEKLTKVFELYIRHRDNWTCITCGVHIPNNTQLMHAGHYIGRGNEQVKWNEYNVNAQCRSCNGKEHWSGDKNTYALALKAKYDIPGASIKDPKLALGILDYLEYTKKGTIKLSIPDLQEMTKYYQDKLDSLTSER